MFKEFHHHERGRGHTQEGTPVQDRVRFLSRGGVQALCLADGAGSAAHSDIGAQAVVDEGCRLLVEHFHDFASSTDTAEVRSAIITRLRCRLEEIAQRRGHEVCDLASTFLCVAASSDAFLGAHIGDGVIGYLKSGELRVVSGPDNDEFANQTTFVTSSSAAQSMRLFRGSLDEVAGFVLMSDGTADSLFHTRTGQLADACSKLITAVGAAPARQAKNSAYKKQLRRLVHIQIRDATKDDCSLGILGRTLPEAGSADFAASGAIRIRSRRR